MKPAKPPFYPPDLPPDRPQGPIVTNARTGEQHEVLPVTKTCNGWRTEAHCYCANPPGAETIHKGVGRCAYHDMSQAHVGLQRYRLLRETTIGALADTIAVAETDPTNITEELHMARAALMDWLQRYERWQETVSLWASAYSKREVANQPPRAMDISRLDQMVQGIAKLALQLEESRLKDAISQGELIEILRDVGTAVELTVTVCPHCHGSLQPVLELVKQAWSRIQLWGRRKKRE